jgi:hypothetical protein
VLMIVEAGQAIPKDSVLFSLYFPCRCTPYDFRVYGGLKTTLCRASLHGMQTGAPCQLQHPARWQSTER